MVVKYALIKYFAIFISIAQGMIFVWVVTNQFSDTNLAFILLVFGLITYLILFDFGLGKPIYSNLRSLYIKNSPRLSREVKLAKFIFIILILIICGFAMILFLVLYSIYKPDSFHIVTVLLLALFAGLSIGITMFKDVFDAINKFIYWEWHDLARKILLFFATLLIIIDSSLIIFAVTLSFLNLLIIFNLVRYLNNFYKGHALSNLFIRLKSYLNDSYYNFQFRLNELFIYNWGYVVFPLLSEQLLIVYSIFNRLFLGLSVGSRAITDVFIHSLTRMYFNHEITYLRNRLKVIALVGVGISTAVIVFLSLFRGELSEYWLNDKVVLNDTIIIAFSFYIVGNSLIHMLGLFLLSTGSSFKLVSQYSRIVIFATMLSIFFMMYFFELISEVLLVVSGVVYFMSVFWYLNAVKIKLNERESYE